MSSRKVALIEDDKTLSKVLNEELEDAGYRVVRAFDGKAGLRIIQKEKPDLVLLDLVMPKMNGYEVLEALKDSPGTSSIPVIILSNLGEDEDVKKGLKLGAEDYFVKSSHALAEIIEKVDSFIAKGPSKKLQSKSIAEEVEEAAGGAEEDEEENEEEEPKKKAKKSGKKKK